MSNFSNSITSQENILPTIGAGDFVAASSQADIACAWAEWLGEFAVWKSMLTLTVDNDHQCARDTFIKRVRSLVQILNRDLFGSHYIRLVGHSYFSHVLGIEYTQSGVIHGHMLVDRPINFDLTHAVWNKLSGFVFIRQVEDVSGAARYVSKYVVKHEDLVLLYKSTSHRSPAFVPGWYANNL